MLTEQIGPVKVFREKRSARGYPYWLLEDEFVPRIADNVLDCVIYLYPSVQASQGGLQAGGSGFLVGVESSAQEGGVFLYAVTNRHVAVNNLVIRLNTKGGATDTLTSERGHWYFREDQDVAVCPINLASAHKWSYVSAKLFLSQEIIAREKIGPGDDVFMVGRFINHEGRQCNTPSVRFGNLSMMPGEPVSHTTNKPTTQVSFLADIRTVGGYSGSPVFVTTPPFRMDGNNVNFGPPLGPWLLGVEWGYLNDKNGNNTGMSAVVPAWILKDVLDAPHLTAARNAEDARITAARANLGTTLT